MSKRFEELVVWQKARKLTDMVYELTRRREFARDFGLQDQLRRAAVSIMSNIAEGFERGSDTEFGRFLVIAKGSCGEGALPAVRRSRPGVPRSRNIRCCLSPSH